MLRTGPIRYETIMECLVNLRNSVTRKKIANSDLQATPLTRCLSTSDLSLIAIGCMLGSGVYILPGEIVSEIAGPAAIISFAIAGITVLFSALCYLESATRFHETGAAYLYAYATMGELIGFVIGWNSIMIRGLAVTFVSRGWSAYFDNTIGARVSNFTVEVLLGGKPWNLPVISAYPDIIAGVIMLLACILVSLGTRISATVNAIFVLVNITAVSIVAIVSFVYADLSNLTEHGGFSPFGFEGILQGAAACYAGYCGFEAIAFCAEETKDPKRSLPIALGVAFGTTIIFYMVAVLAVSTVANWMEINPSSPFVSAFDDIGVTWVQTIVVIGALISMLGGVLNLTFCLSRVFYVMGRDGMLPSILAKTNKSTQTPVIATMLGGVPFVIAAVFLDFTSVIEILSFTSIFEFIVVSMICVMLRYSKPSNGIEHNEQNVEILFNEINKDGSTKDCNDMNETESLLPVTSQSLKQKIASILIPLRRLTDKNPATTVLICLVTMILSSVLVLYVLMYMMDEVLSSNSFLIFLVSVSTVLAITACVPLWTLNQNPEDIPFKVPFMPVTPLISILSNLILIVRFRGETWIEVAVWMALGIFCYFIYGIHHSKAADRSE